MASGEVVVRGMMRDKSSAYFTTVTSFDEATKLPINAQKMDGPRTEPCGTPFLIHMGFESFAFILRIPFLL